MNNENLEGYLPIFQGKTTCSITPSQMLACNYFLTNISIRFHLACFTSKMFVCIPELVYQFVDHWSLKNSVVSHCNIRWHVVECLYCFMQAASLCLFIDKSKSNQYMIKFDPGLQKQWYPVLSFASVLFSKLCPVAEANNCGMLTHLISNFSRKVPVKLSGGLETETMVSRRERLG